MKKCFRAGVFAGILLGILTFTVTAADIDAGASETSENNGYWTMTTDESGMPVMIYTYTEKVDWVVDERAGLGHCDMDSAGADTAQTITPMAASTVTGTQADTAAEAVNAVSSPKNQSFDYTKINSLLLCSGSLFSLMLAGYLYKRKNSALLPGKWK